MSSNSNNDTRPPQPAGSRNFRSDGGSFRRPDDRATGGSAAATRPDQRPPFRTGRHA